MEDLNNLKALIFGSTGAVGREVVSELLQSNKWSEVHVIVRRELEKWEKLPEEQKRKMKIIKMENLDQLQETKNFIRFKGVDSIFCCLGSQQKHGKENFINVDYHYPQYAADIALANSIPHFSLVSTISANANSLFFYLQLKGEVEDNLLSKRLPFLSIFRPGFLLNRQNDQRFIERIGHWLPFTKKVETRDVAIAMRKDAEQCALLRRTAQTAADSAAALNRTTIFENDTIVGFAAATQL